MVRVFVVGFFLGFLAVGGAAFAQSAADVDNARTLYIEGEYESALAILLPAAKAGSAVAQNVVGVAHEDGAGVARDPKAAITWYEKAADQGLGKAMYNLAHLYRQGAVDDAGKVVVEVDPAKARALFEQAAEAKYGPAYANLAAMYLSGEGGPQREDAVFGLYQAGDAAGDAHATDSLGTAYRLGELVTQDLPRAVQFYKKAAEAGLAQGMNNYARMLELGSGTAVDYDDARVWYESAMLGGDALAGYNLATMITDGHVPDLTPVDAGARCVWAMLRADAGQAFVRDDCEKLLTDLGAETRAEAEFLADGL